MANSSAIDSGSWQLPDQFKVLAPKQQATMEYILRKSGGNVIFQADGTR
jgi:hypothetical protein